MRKKLIYIAIILSVILVGFKSVAFASNDNEKKNLEE